MSRPKIVHGARVLIYINGKLFGRCTSFSWTSNTPRKPIHVIDTLHPVELAPVAVDVSWTMGALRTVGDGGLQGVGAVAFQSDLSREKYFTLQLVERTSGLTIFRSDFCNTDAENWVVGAKAVAAGTASGKGITWVNEAAQ